MAVKKSIGPPAKARRYSAGGKDEIKKAWLRDAAAGFVRVDPSGIGALEGARSAQAFRAVHMACLLWDLVEGAFHDETQEKAGH